jgi:hypothetical protein
VLLAHIRKKRVDFSSILLLPIIPLARGTHCSLFWCLRLRSKVYAIS